MAHRGVCFNKPLLPILVCLCLAAWLSVPTAQALNTDTTLPVQVQADRIEVNQQTGVTTYRGNVRFDNGDIGIQADTVEMRQRAEVLHGVMASGAPVRFQQAANGTRAEIRGVATRVDYNADRREITLTGNVRMEQSGDVFEAATVHYQLDDGMMRAEGGPGQGRVRAVLAPRRLEQARPAP